MGGSSKKKRAGSFLNNLLWCVEANLLRHVPIQMDNKHDLSKSRFQPLTHNGMQSWVACVAYSVCVERFSPLKLTLLFWKTLYELL